MDWIKDIKYKWYEILAMNIIKIGPLPQHIAIILDGNRRFARISNTPAVEGHTKGFDKLSQLIKWCLDIGVKEITAFGFSIENFKRNSDEVNDLMKLATEKFKNLLKDEENLRENGVRVRVIGNITMLPVELQELIAKVTLITENHNKLDLNIAFAYTSREEITNAIQTILEDCGENLQPNDINEEVLRQCLYTKHCTDPDLLIRTSGETRISDFLMWQITSTVLHFTKALWPAITLWHFLFGIFSYQRSMMNILHFKDVQLRQQQKSEEHLPGHVKSFLRKIDTRRRDVFVNLANATKTE